MEHNREPAVFSFETNPHVLIVEGRFYDDIADMQLSAARTVLGLAGATHEVLTVPGALEIPAVIACAVKALDFDALRRRFDGYVALACVLKGGTQHDEIVGNESARGLQELAIRHCLAIGNGILTCATKEQALERADAARQDRAGAAAEACLRMIEIKQQLRLTPKRRWLAGGR
ncbi:MAG: 6,7-dimethyl-8-ribityllumazine synthase [Bdellovibrionales bacterium]